MKLQIMEKKPKPQHLPEKYFRTVSYHERGITQGQTAIRRLLIFRDGCGVALLVLQKVFCDPSRADAGMTRNFQDLFARST